MKHLLIALTIIVAQAIPATAQSREKGLDHWMDRSLVPYVRQQLQSHPRFKGQTVTFVVLQDNAPTPTTNALALSIRDRLLESALDSGGISIGWQQGNKPVGLQGCQSDDVHYHVGIELSQELDGSYAVNVRALDLGEREWVAGFGRRWQGKLTTIQRQAMRQSRVDETFLGAREVPFTVEQTDLLAAHLAHSLNCTLQRQLEGDYIVIPAAGPEDTPLAGTVELIGNNLANNQALVLTGNPEKTNAVLSGKAHPINGRLHQYWLTITPTSETDGLSALSASAYVLLPETSRPTLVIESEPVETNAAVVAPASLKVGRSVSVPTAGADGLIGPLSITGPANIAECEWPCSMLRSKANVDAIVFFLEHQAGYGLVRLASGDCRNRTVARVVREGETVSFPISRKTTDAKKWREAYEWQLDPELDTFYAIAITDADMARNMANVMDKLPQRCANALRPGLTESELETWLQDFAEFAAGSARHLDWRALQVRDVM